MWALEVMSRTELQDDKENDREDYFGKHCNDDHQEFRRERLVYCPCHNDYLSGCHVKNGISQYDMIGAVGTLQSRSWLKYQ